MNANPRPKNAPHPPIQKTETGPFIPAGAQEIPKEQQTRPTARERIRIEIAADFDRPMPRPRAPEPVQLDATHTYYPHREPMPREAEFIPAGEPAPQPDPVSRAEAQAQERESAQVLGTQARVVAMDGDRAVLEDGRRPALAVSCIVRPEPGDTVLVAHAPLLVLAVLERPGTGGAARINVPGAVSVKLQQERIALEATQSLALRSLRDAELTAVGSLGLTARNLFTHAVETLVERAADRIAKVGSFALDATRLLRIQSRHGVVRAEKQLCLDAEQIHLG